MTRIIDLGKVMATPAGEWRGDASYEFLSVVSHNGSGYISRVDNTGIEPGTNDNVWMLLVSAGESPKITRDAKGNIYVDGALLTSAFADAEAAARRIVETETSVRAAEQGRVNAENARVTAERLRVEAENLRQQSENGRKSNESARVNAEAARKNAETLRASAETSRASAEQTRMSSEQYRSGNETERVSRFEALSAELESAIAAAREAARTVKAKAGEQKLVIGRAIPANTWRPGVSYFCRTGEFNFRARVIWRSDSTILYNDRLDFETPLPAALTPILTDKIWKVHVTGNADGIWYPEGHFGFELYINGSNEITGIEAQGLADRCLEIAGSPTDTPFCIVFRTEDLGCNTLTNLGSWIKKSTITSAAGFSPYLYVSDSRVVCTKPPVIIRRPDLDGSGLFHNQLYKRTAKIQRRKRRKTTRGSDSSKLSKVRWMKTEHVPSFKHALNIRYRAICRHFKSILWEDVHLPRMPKNAVEEEGEG